MIRKDYVRELIVLRYMVFIRTIARCFKHTDVVKLKLMIDEMTEKDEENHSTCINVILGKFYEGIAMNQKYQLVKQKHWKFKRKDNISDSGVLGFSFLIN
uniref:Putative beta-glucosidase n=1 Tax=Lygus hesperus TaxID=30085 RepID=A0A0A9YL16_LYGHE